MKMILGRRKACLINSCSFCPKTSQGPAHQANFGMNYHHRMGQVQSRCFYGCTCCRARQFRLLSCSPQCPNARHLQKSSGLIHANKILCTGKDWSHAPEVSSRRIGASRVPRDRAYSATIWVRTLSHLDCRRARALGRCAAPSPVVRRCHRACPSVTIPGAR
jgi:hypothetical protein